ncbi:MAG: aminoacyl-tRNA hydrolase [Clostridia bacterium]|nr:aminoacyl-tRNA hydrolase [Clostridia bacterium]
MFFRSKNGSFEYMVVGLGNPGIQYENTRHNAGFLGIDALCKRTGAKLNKHKFESLIGDTVIGGKRTIILKPQTFMNNSGRAVSAVSRFYKMPADKIIVLFDDISLPVGNIRIRRKGSAGGHNGIKDIIELMGTDNIMRIKIGVGDRPNSNYDLKDWVLGKMPSDLADDFNRAFESAAKAIEEIITVGIDSAMNKYSK